LSEGLPANTEGLLATLPTRESGPEPEELPSARDLMSMQVLQAGLRKLLDCDTDLLSQRTLGEDLLSKLSQ
jgi:hypothetical protein